MLRNLISEFYMNMQLWKRVLVLLSNDF